MLFNSFSFLLFFPIVTLIYFLLPHRFRWLHLLVASCIFYMAFVPVFILILLFTIIVDYWAAILIENSEGTRRKWFLVGSIVANLGVLVVFKYYNFFIVNIQHGFDLMHVDASLPLLSMVLPIGLSFHTFQAMSYTIEVYRGHQKAERHFGIYSLYVMFYPQLVAGPIERPQNLLHQFHSKHSFKYDKAVSGLRQMLWGLVKKVIIADRLAIVSDSIFNQPYGNSGTLLLIGAIFFTFQIFCDFSGYSDIAIGAARVMGFELMTNFDKPYSSRSISEFWRRWHISLSTWFKDYLYIPLGGNRVAIPRIYFNLFLVFLVSGFWHGASWTFIVWGALHGFYIVFALVTKDVRKKINDAIGISRVPWLNDSLDKLITFGLVVTGWIFFRANNIKDAFYIVRRICNVPAEMVQAFATHKIAHLKLPGIYNSLLPCFTAILFLELAHMLQGKFKIEKSFSKIPTPARWAVYCIGVIGILLLGVFEKREFIYFQF